MPPDLKAPLLEIAYLLMPTLWVGLLLGVSFIATPAKFLSASLARPVAFDVGRKTFAVWNNVEWLLLAGLAALAAQSAPGNVLARLCGVLFVLLLVQTAVLLPALNARVSTIIAGADPPAAPDHAHYVALDLLKVVTLLACVWHQGARATSLFTAAG